MDPKTRSIIIGAVALIILAAVVGAIFFFGRISRNGTDVPEQIGLETLPSVEATPSPASGVNTSPQTGTADTKNFIADGVLVKYPASWGLLTCSTNSNFELDPISSADVKGVVCGYALKPVTVLIVNSLNCPGELVTLGSNRVTKSKSLTNGTTFYRWCTSVGNKNFDITHRVSSSGSRATSTTDFSPQVEQMIKDLQVAPAGS